MDPAIPGNAMADANPAVTARNASVFEKEWIVHYELQGGSLPFFSHARAQFTHAYSYSSVSGFRTTALLSSITEPQYLQSTLFETGMITPLIVHDYLP